MIMNYVFHFPPKIISLTFQHQHMIQRGKSQYRDGARQKSIPRNGRAWLCVELHSRDKTGLRNKPVPGSQFTHAASREDKERKIRLKAERLHTARRLFGEKLPVPRPRQG